MSNSLLAVGVKLKAVSFKYPDQSSKFISSSELILDCLSLEIQSGDFVSILGPSGCGKSTFLRLLADLDQPQSGSLEFNNSDPKREIKRGFVFQEPRLLPWRTVLENVMLPLDLKMPSREVKKQARAQAVEALSKVGLTHAENYYPAQLSGGMKMRVSVARALISQPRLLLLDEPFSAIDEKTREELQADLRALWQTERMTVVFVTHSITEAVYLSNRVIVFSKAPARVVLDRKIELPVDRPRESLTDLAFRSEIKNIRNALSSTEALDL